MMYDPARSGDVMDRLLENAQKMVDQSGAGRPTTNKGYTMTRAAGVARPVMLSLTPCRAILTPLFEISHGGKPYMI